MQLYQIDERPPRNPIRNAINRETENLRYLRRRRAEMSKRSKDKLKAELYRYNLDMIDRSIRRIELKRVALLRKMSNV